MGKTPKICVVFKIVFQILGELTENFHILWKKATTNIKLAILFNQIIGSFPFVPPSLVGAYYLHPQMPYF